MTHLNKSTVLTLTNLVYLDLRFIATRVIRINKKYVIDNKRSLLSTIQQKGFFFSNI